MKRILALTDSVTTCDCCGRTNLKATYAVTDDLGGEFYYGTTCIKRNLGYSKEDIQKDLNETKNFAQNEASQKSDQIKALNLHPLLETRALKDLRKEICEKYKIQYY